MPNEPPRHRKVPDRLPPEPVSRSGHGTRVQIELKGPSGCLAGSVILALALGLVVIAVVAGLIAAAAAFWIASAILVVLAAVVALRKRNN